jgi:L-alanine-DL-glutamate epimerase-like enolase superfamily enzyme
VQEDVAVVRAIRKAAGEDMAIMVDYNQCLTPTETVERLRVLDDEGLTWVEEPTLAHTKGMRVSNHLWPEISARLLCSTPTAHWLEYADWWNLILAEPLRIEKGMAIIDDAFGTGVEWNEDVVSRFSA